MRFINNLVQLKLTALLVMIIQVRSRIVCGVGVGGVVGAGRGDGRERRAVHCDGRALYGRGVARRYHPAAVHRIPVATRAVTAAPVVPTAHDLLEQILL